MPFIGELAALFTSFCWSLSAIGFTFGGRLVGSQVVNRVRVALAFLALLVINWALYGKPIPFDAGSERWFWLTLSGIVGLAFGDAFLFQSYQLVGPRIGLLMMSLAPIFGTIIAWLFLGETLTTLQFAGMVIAMLGIAWVVLARNSGGVVDENPAQTAQGVLFGALAAVGQAGGLVLSKQGMTGDFPPFAGTLMRLVAAIVVLWGLSLIQGQAGKTVSAVREHPKALKWTAFGALFGPVIGVSASLLSVQYAKVGVASTLMALPPVFMLPISYFVFKERFGWQAVAGTALAMLGVALLFLA